jgi:hypothetical protein
MSGETHVTVSMATGQTPRVNVSIYPDDAARLEAKVLPSGTPLLKIEHGDAQVTMWPYEPAEITDNDIATARDRAAMIYQHATRDADRKIADALDARVKAERPNKDDDGAAGALIPA